LQIIKDEGFGADCSSESEAWIAKKLDMEGMYTGNYTTKEEFEFVMRTGLILNLDDISMLNTVAELGMPETISFRINPGMSKAGMENLIMAGPDAKYGVPFEKAAEAYSRAKELGAKHFGIHMMTGSNVPTKNSNYFPEVIGKLLDIVADVKKKTGIDIEFLNMGGGFGVPYRPEEKSLDMEKIAKAIKDMFDLKIKEHGIIAPRLMAEPGRWISANAGWLISKANVIKDSYKKFVGIDASSNDMPRPAIYNAYHHVSVVGKKDNEETVSIVGGICENSDQFARDRSLPKIEIGDTIAIHNCGAHAYAMGHNYNGRGRHAEYLLKPNGDIVQIRKAETIQDLFRTVVNFDKLND
jgi:diaminopimelate decarboxylase